MSSLRLQLRCPNSKRVVLSHLSSESSLGDLRAAIAQESGIGAGDQRILVGFPPKELQTNSDSVSLTEISIKSGDSLLVEKATESARGIVKAAAGSGVAVFSIPKGKGHFVRRVMPMDNSCLFHSIAYVCLDRAHGQAENMRQIVKKEVLSNPRVYTPVVLGQSAASYCDWIMNKNVWGGAIELDIFANHFKCEIVAFDPIYLREDVYGREKGFQKRVFLLYSSEGVQQQGGHSAHYDSLVFSPFGNASESADRVVFGSADLYAWERARGYIEHLHKEAVTKDSKLTLQKKWRRTKSGDEAPIPQGRSMLSTPSSAAASTTTKGTGWQCSACTFLNNDVMPSCEICGGAK